MSSNIKDVAKLANVSISTVSRVINNAPNVKPNTHKKVMDAIEKLNFKPNRVAQSLGGGYFHAIGIVSTRSSNQAFENPYFSTILQAIGSVAEDNNFDIILNCFTDEKKEIERCINMIESKVVKGIIILSSRNNNVLIRKLNDLNFPFVVVGRILDDSLMDDVYTIDTNNLKDCTEAVNYLIKLGHKKIACIHAPLKYVVSKDRLEGYIEAHKESHVPVNYSFIKDGGYDVEDSYKATLELLKNEDKPTAIFATDDLKAIGAYKAIIELGMKIPDDISIVGHNNYYLSQLTSPSLTTINVPIYDLGINAAKILFDIINNLNPPKRTILDTQFITRDSCKKL